MLYFSYPQHQEDIHRSLFTSYLLLSRCFVGLDKITSFAPHSIACVLQGNPSTPSLPERSAYRPCAQTLACFHSAHNKSFTQVGVSFREPDPVRGTGSGFSSVFEHMLDQTLCKCCKAPEIHFCSKLKPRPCMPFVSDIEAL